MFDAVSTTAQITTKLLSRTNDGSNTVKCVVDPDTLTIHRQRYVRYEARLVGVIYGEECSAKLRGSDPSCR